jgi:tetratricopeptide (TPR) repeat protein
MKRQMAKVKMFCRRSAAYAQTGENDKAITDLELALKIDPENESIKADMLTLKT